MMDTLLMNKDGSNSLN